MTKRLITIPFARDSIIATTIKNKLYVAIEPICAATKLDWPSQRKRILQDSILSEYAVITTMQTSSGPKKMLFLPLEQFYSWLLNIHFKSVRPEFRETLHTYKRDCHRTLCERFFGSSYDDVKRKKKKYDINLNRLYEHFDEINTTWSNQIQPVLKTLQSPVSDRLQDRFDECSALISMLHHKNRQRHKI